MEPDFRLETERLILRLFEMTDIQPFYDYRSDPEVARYQGWEIPFTFEMAQSTVFELMRPGETGQFHQIALELKSTGEMIGDVAFRILSTDHPQAEIGFTLAQRFQGQGYATESVDQLIEYLFTDLDLHRITADIDPANSASEKLLTRLGFRHEGRFIENCFLRGEWVDEDWYAILRREWRSTAHPGIK